MSIAVERNLVNIEVSGNLAESDKANFVIPLEVLGIGDLERVGGKTLNLGLMLKAKLPVPVGYAITVGGFEEYLKTGVVPEILVREVVELKGKLGGKVAIRSSATFEDGQDLSMAGVFSSFYVYGDEEITKAIESIYSQAMSDEVEQYLRLHSMRTEEVRMGLVVQELIEPDISGVIYTDTNKGKVLVQYNVGFGQALVDGTTHGSAVLVDRVSQEILQSMKYEGKVFSREQIGQILEYVDRLEDTFLFGDQDIEFAYRGGEFFILQARPLTTEIGDIELDETVEDTLEIVKAKLKRLAIVEKQELGTNNAVFTNYNFIELLPRATEMDAGVFSYIFSGSDGIDGAIQLGRREMGYPLGQESIGFMKYIGGKPYISIARDSGTFYAGFPSSSKEYFASLVNEYLAAMHEDPSKAIYPEMGLYLQDPTIEDLWLRFDEKADGYFEVYQRFTRIMAGYADTFLTLFQQRYVFEMDEFVGRMKARFTPTFSVQELNEYTNEILEHLRTVSCVNFVKSARLGFYYSQRMQLELRRKFQLPESEVEQAFAFLSQGLEGSKITDVNITLAGINTDENALELANDLVGHYSTGEMLQLRHQRLKDDPDALRGYVFGIRKDASYVENYHQQKAEREILQETLLSSLTLEDRRVLEDIIFSAQKYMALRETIKYQFVREYDLIRDALELIGSRIGLEKDDIYYVYPRELSKLIEDVSSFKHIIRSRRQAFINYEALDLPTVIRESDIESLGIKRDDGVEFLEASGKFLAGGVRMIGTVVNVDEFSSATEVEEVIKKYKDLHSPIILVATQMNLSHDPFINAADGIVIENAGIVSHGAQRARELGKGAIGGIKASQLKTGMKIDFDPMSRVVKKITEDEKN